MDVRLYPIRASNQIALSNDGAGKIAGLYCKSFTLSAQLDTESTLPIPLIDAANGASIQSYMVQIRNQNGGINVAGTHIAAYTPATGILSVTAKGNPLLVSSTITIFYIVAVK